MAHADYEQIPNYFLQARSGGTPIKWCDYPYPGHLASLHQRPHLGHERKTQDKNVLQHIHSGCMGGGVKDHAYAASRYCTDLASSSGLTPNIDYADDYVAYPPGPILNVPDLENNQVLLPTHTSLSEDNIKSDNDDIESCNTLSDGLSLEEIIHNQTAQKDIEQNLASSANHINGYKRPIKHSLIDEENGIFKRKKLINDIDLISFVVGKPLKQIITSGPKTLKLIEDEICSGSQNASFLVTDLAKVYCQFLEWSQQLPMVEPFYAVKCNPDPAIVRLLAALGCAFDCATMGEIELVLHGLGSDLSLGSKNAPKSVVYANPAKMDHMLRYAVENGVRMTVFDGVDELYKIAKLPEPHRSNVELLLRLTTDDRASICRFSKKFGCPVSESEELLVVAKKLGLCVAGVSFHVGSGCGDVAAYTKALEDASFVFETADRLGMKPMYIVDIGGGFPGDDITDDSESQNLADQMTQSLAKMPTFREIAKAVRDSLVSFTEKFSSSRSLRYIAEPGRFFVASSTTIVTKVYSRKGGSNAYQALYVDDGVYGSFNNVVYDHANPVPKRLALPGKLQKPASLLDSDGDDLVNSKANQAKLESFLDGKKIPTAVFGPTCDGLDQMCALESTSLERCEVGDWLYWESQGAYTHTASFVFNGYTHIPPKVYCFN